MHEVLVKFNEALMSQLLPAIAAVAAGYILALLHKLLKRVGLELDSRSDAKLQYVVEKWVKFAEEHVEAQFKNGLIKFEEKALEKLNLAIEGVVGEVPVIGEERAEVLVKAAVLNLGLGAANKGVDFLVEKIQPAAK